MDVFKEGAGKVQQHTLVPTGKSWANSRQRVIVCAHQVATIKRDDAFGLAGVCDYSKCTR